MTSAATTAALLAAACSGGGGGDKGLAPADGRITSGRYRVTTSQVVQDECAVVSQDNINGLNFTFTVNGETITLGQISGTYRNGVITLDNTTEYDWSSDGFDCVEDDRFYIEGRTPTNDSITDGTLLLQWREKSGSECDEAYQAYSDAIGETVALPCDTEITFEMESFPLQSGTLNTAHGMNAPLKVSGAGQGNDVRYLYTLGAVATSASNVAWSCYAPDPPTFPHYEIFAGDLYIVVTTAQWSVGSKTIDGTNVAVEVNGDLSAEATGGTLNLVAAPLTTGQNCSFSMGNVPISESASFARPNPSRRVLGQK